MFSLLLDDTTSSNIWSWVLIAAVILILIAMPLVMNSRNKKESQKVQEQTNSLKVGDNVLTTSGVYGTITEIKFDETRKAVVIETGGKNKSYMTVDAYAIYTVFKSEKELALEAEEKAAAEKAKQDAKKSKKKKNSEKTVEEQVAEVTQEEEKAPVVEEEEEKPNSSKKTKTSAQTKETETKAEEETKTEETEKKTKKSSKKSS